MKVFFSIIILCFFVNFLYASEGAVAVELPNYWASPDSPLAPEEGQDKMVTLEDFEKYFPNTSRVLDMSLELSDHTDDTEAFIPIKTLYVNIMCKRVRPVVKLASSHQIDLFSPQGCMASPYEYAWSVGNTDFFGCLLRDKAAAKAALCFELESQLAGCKNLSRQNFVLSASFGSSGFSLCS
ncbi:hypothetical protein HN446_01950 [bacterium]|jgi:hypothetical protein|nr:hypothetical protein [bacterium]